jgi:hypothetical protein
MPDTTHSLADKLSTEGNKTYSFFSTLTEEQWRVSVYNEGIKWTPRSILAHLLTTERGFLRLFEEIRQGKPGASPEFSIDRYNARQQEKMKDLTPSDLLPQFLAVRSEMISFVASLQRDDLEISARHPALGIANLAAMIKMIYIHNQQHIRDIKIALGGTAPVISP